MWYVDDQSMVTSEYQLSADLSTRLDQASLMLNENKEEIIAQALREFFDKHGIRGSQGEA